MSASITLINSTDIHSYDDNNFTSIRGMASSNDGSKMYLVIAVVTGYGILKSTNYGVSWQAINPNDGNTAWYFTSIACSSDGTIVYATHLGNGLYKSIDSGQTWNYVFAGGQSLPGIENYSSDNVYQVTCDATGTKLIMTTNYSKVIYRSTDGGVTWINVYNIPNASDYPQNAITLTSNVDGSVIYAAFNTSDLKIYKSTNHGNSWSVISTLGTVTGPFSSIATNLTGDFVFACSSNGDLNIFYETHAVKSVLPAFNGSLVTTVACYNNGYNVLVMINNATQTYSVANLFPPGPIPQPSNIPCFNENTKILCLKDSNEVYVNIQDIRKGDLVKTLRNGYVPVNIIGTSKIYNPNNSMRSKHRLYICKPNKYPSLIEELIITGCHSILTDTITDIQRAKTIGLLGKIYVTDNNYRLIACIDDKAEPYMIEGVFNIWHLALDNDNLYMNYGIYANGLLVESCPINYLKLLSGMTLIE